MCCRVRWCCCCVGLRSGVIAIASFCLLVDACLLAWSSFMAYIIDANADALMSQASKDPNYSEDEKEFFFLLLNLLYWLGVVGAILASLGVLLDIMLLAGAVNARRKLVQGWVVAYAVLYVISVLFHVLCIITHFHTPTYYMTVGVTAAVPVHVGLMVYFWTVVRSYYLQLGEQYDDPRAGKVYCTLSSGDVPTIQGIYSYPDTVSMKPKSPPQYSSYA